MKIKNKKTISLRSFQNRLVASSEPVAPPRAPNRLTHPASTTWGFPLLQTIKAEDETGEGLESGIRSCCECFRP